MSNELIDFSAVAADLERMAATHSGSERDLRAALAQRLKAALTEFASVFQPSGRA